MASIRHESLDREDREDVPFLNSPNPNSPSPAHSHVHSKPSIGSRPVKANASASAISFRLKAILFAMVLAVEIGFAFLEGPMVRIMESIACRQYFLDVDPTKIGADGQVPEAVCKIGEVQAELAAVKGYHMFFDGSLSRSIEYPRQDHYLIVPQALFWRFLMVCWQTVVAANLHSLYLFPGLG